MCTLHKKNRIVSFDLDMTLLNHANWEIPSSAMQAIERLRKDSIIVIASGRDMNSTYSIPYRNQVRPDAIIHLNGTRIEVEDKKVIFEHFMDKEKMRRLLEFAQEHTLSVGVSIEGEDFYTHPHFVEEHDKKLWGMSKRNFKEPFELLHLPVRTLTYIGGPEGDALLCEHFPEFKFPMFEGKTGADIMEREASKANGLKCLCEYYGIDPKNTVAFGDSMNDYEILQVAGIGVAMGNAIEELKPAADYITTHIAQDGIWNACKALKLF